MEAIVSTRFKRLYGSVITAHTLYPTNLNAQVQSEEYGWVSFLVRTLCSLRNNQPEHVNTPAYFCDLCSPLCCRSVDHRSTFRSYQVDFRPTPLRFPFRSPSSSTFSKPFSVFLDEFNSFLSFAATTPHEFIITGDFNIHLDNHSDRPRYLSVSLSSVII